METLGARGSPVTGGDGIVRWPILAGLVGGPAAPTQPQEVARDNGRVLPVSPVNTLYCGDNLDVLRNHDLFRSESVDLIYLDPPFNSKRDYHMLQIIRGQGVLRGEAGAVHGRAHHSGVPPTSGN